MGTKRPNLLRRIEDKTAKVGVIGLGYVGLPLAIAIAEAGFQVTGIDALEGKVQNINSGHSCVKDIEGSELPYLVKKGLIKATTEYGVVQDLDIINICIPTPLNRNKEPDLGALEAVLQSLCKFAGGDQLFILQSTTFPGTTQEVVLPRLQQGNKRVVGRDFYLAFSPERVDPGNKKYGIKNTPKVVGGVTNECTQIAAAFFEEFVDQVHPVSCCEVAEFSKLLENIYRNVNIALVNELRMLCDRMNVDIHEVIEAAATKPFGFTPFSPGPGVGGHCIPVDPFYLSWKAREYDFYTKFIQLAAETNDNVPYYIVERITEILNQDGQPLSDRHLLLLGMAFKPNVSDIRNSPAVRIGELLQRRGAHVQYHDPYVETVDINGLQLTSLPVSEIGEESFSAVIILVNHSSFNLPTLLAGVPLVIDVCNATGWIDLPNSAHIVKI